MSLFLPDAQQVLAEDWSSEMARVVAKLEAPWLGYEQQKKTIRVGCYLFPVSFLLVVCDPRDCTFFWGPVSFF